MNKFLLKMTVLFLLLAFIRHADADQQWITCQVTGQSNINSGKTRDFVYMLDDTKGKFWAYAENEHQLSSSNSVTISKNSITRNDNFGFMNIDRFTGKITLGLNNPNGPLLTWAGECQPSAPLPLGDLPRKF